MAHALVADDDRLVRSFLEKALTFGGHSVVTASDGLEATRLVDRAGCFELLVVDHMMPGATGIDVIAHAREVDPSIASVIVTANRDLDVAVQGMHAGAVGYIAKPFKTEHLLAVVGGALRHRDLLVEATRLRVLTPMLERFAVVLANTVESKDVATQEHASRLVELSAAVCKRLGLAADATDAIRLGACLHDIGKIAVPEELLRRPGSLTDEEVAIVRRHPEVGASILEGIRTWEEVRLIVRHHHERFDGRGYPSGLKGSRIPLGARIVGVVDAYDVMRGGRPYSAPKPPEAILSELVRERGRQFDPDVVDAFVATLPPDALDDQGAIPDATLVYSRGVPTRLRRKPAAGLHPVRA